MKLLRQTADDELEALTSSREEKESLRQKHVEEVTACFDEKIAEVDSEDMFLDLDEEEDGPQQTLTKQEREESLAVATSLRKQQAQLQEAVKLAEQAEGAANAADPAAPTVQQEHEKWADLWLDFHAEPDQLPKASDEPSPEELATLTALLSMFAAIPWGTSLPTLNFEALGAAPSLVHGLVGDSIWQECWKDRHPHISGTHMVPYKLLNIIKSAVLELSIQLSEDQKAKGKQRLGVVQQWSEKKRTAGPYGRQ